MTEPRPATAPASAGSGPLRIANCSGGYGDRLSAAREMADGGPIDVLTGDYVSELTMFTLGKAKRRDPDAGYAASFLAQMHDVLATCLERGIKIVVNAGGVNPVGLVRALSELAAAGGLHPKTAHVAGDDLLGRLAELQSQGHEFAHLASGQPLAEAEVRPVTANACLGGWGIAEALKGGADVVVCGRVTAASLVVGPAAWAFDWAADDWDALAGAAATGHILAGGAQAGGGNFSFFTEIPDPVHPGFPIAEMHPDGSCVITKHRGTGGAVTVETVTAQLLCGIDRPAHRTPDVVARLDTLRLAQDGPDRVAVTGARGEPAPETLKVCITYHGGCRNSATFVLTGLDIDAKAEFARASVLDAMGGEGRFAAVDFRLVRQEGGARLTVTVTDPDERKAGRDLFAAATATGLSGYPGLHLENASPRASEYGVHWPTLLSAGAVPQEAVLPDGRRAPAPRPPTRGGRTAATSRPAHGSGAPVPAGPTVRAPLGTLIGARSGDRGGDATVGLWARSDAAYAWLRAYLDTERLRRLLPDAEHLPVSRCELTNLRAVNFVVHGLLGRGVAAAIRPDPQAKALGEYLRACQADIPAVLLGA